MRIIVFAITLFLGFYSTSFFNSTGSAPCKDSESLQRDFGAGQPKIFSHNVGRFDTSRNYTEAEARALIGKKVRNLTHLNAKCPKDAGNCLNLYKGEVGEVVGILPSIADTFLIEIQWNDRLEDGSQHSGRFVTRAGKEVSFEILD